MIKPTGKINIGLFSLAYSPFVGGAEIAAREITDRLKEFNFVCLTYRFDRRWQTQERIGNVDTVRLGKGGEGQKDYYGHHFQKLLYIFRAWREAERIHKTKPFKLIWAVMASYAGIAALLFKFCHPRIPFLLTIQEGDSEKHILRRVGIFYPFWKQIFRKADYIQVISNYLADFSRRHGAICPIEVVPNGVDIEKLKTKNLKLKTKNLKTIITTSRLVYKNGIDILIRAIAELKNQLPTTNYQLLILGSGPEEEKLKKLARDLNIENQVEFLGYIDSRWIPGYLAKADIFVRPSRSEGLGNSFLEAMAAGLPVIGTPVGGIPDFLKDPSLVGIKEATGLFCKVDDPRDLADKISLLLENTELYKQIAKNGRKLVLKNYDWDNIAKRMGRIFNKLQTKL